MKEKHKMVIIYLPNGNEAKYTTSKDLMPEFELAEEIICDIDKVDVVVKEDGKIEGKSYVRMPYYLEMF